MGRKLANTLVNSAFILGIGFMGFGIYNLVANGPKKHSDLVKYEETIGSLDHVRYSLRDLNQESVPHTLGRREILVARVEELSVQHDIPKLGREYEKKKDKHGDKYGILFADGFASVILGILGSGLVLRRRKKSLDTNFSSGGKFRMPNSYPGSLG
tara:strand:- start:351 stop:818 length:468 start_codon:yes stop_codon:yes gene_type:complete